MREKGSEPVVEKRTLGEARSNADVPVPDCRPVETPDMGTSSSEVERSSCWRDCWLSVDDDDVFLGLCAADSSLFWDLASVVQSLVA